MKIKQHIYHWLFFLLPALMLAGSTISCSNDSVIEEKEIINGKTSLVVTVRSITTNSQESTTFYDEYVETLRIIGFDTSGNIICNGFHNSLEQVTNQESISITQELNKFQGGTCHLYFIANEENYNTTTSQSLTDFLGNANLNEESLQNYIIASNNNEWGSNPILMTAQKSPYIQAGKTEQNIGKIELVRCVAKVQLQIIDETNTAKINGIPTLSGSYPDSYSLLDVGTYIAWKNENESFSVELQEKEDDNTLYTSQEVYFPERLFTQNNNTEENALKFKFNLNDKPYEVAIADNTGTDFNIYRNTHYTVIATLKKKETVTFNVLVNAWDEKTMEVPAFE